MAAGVPEVLVSICMSTYDHTRYLVRTLDSIFLQDLPGNTEIIVVDDGSPETETRRVCQRHPRVEYVRIDREPGYRNPSAARNVAYRRARGEIVVCQSDDVIHRGQTIQTLVNELHEGEFLVGTVYNRDEKGRPRLLYGRFHELTGNHFKRHLFFLGALWRKDLYAIGGNDERFTAPGREDVWFGDCLMNGLGLIPRYLSSVVGYHQDHPRPVDLGRLCRPSHELYRRLHRDASRGLIPWASEGAPWAYEGDSTPLTSGHAPSRMG